MVYQVINYLKIGAKKKRRRFGAKLLCSDFRTKLNPSNAHIHNLLAKMHDAWLYFYCDIWVMVEGKYYEYDSMNVTIERD